MLIFTKFIKLFQYSEIEKNINYINSIDNQNNPCDTEKKEVGILRIYKLKLHESISNEWNMLLKEISFNELKCKENNASVSNIILISK